MATELITITREDAPILAVHFVGPLGNYFAKIAQYFTDEKAAVSVEINLAEVPGYHKSWSVAVIEAIREFRIAEILIHESCESMKAEQAAERRNEEILGGFGHYEEEYFGFGYL